MYHFKNIIVNIILYLKLKVIHQKQQYAIQLRNNIQAQLIK